ncbi:MAG: hypothetical protein RL141_1061 [Candidatus Parcubacteria bacterium]|jgi:dTMP kinase
MPAPFIVIDGTDGSGKATQTKLLVERLRREGRKAEQISFPSYGQPSAFFVEQFQAHQAYGAPADMPARTASVLYAVDRFHHAKEIRTMREQGTIVISDRYVSANKGHQTSKIADPAERRAFVAWLNEFEYGIMGVPKPDITVLLHVSAEIGYALQERKAHEASLEHLTAAEAAYLELPTIDTAEHWITLECMEQGALLPIQEIHERLWTLLRPHLFS